MNEYTAKYRDWTIVVDHERREFMAYPTSQGPQHDYDLVGESYQYCGNCLWNSNEDGLKADIDDAIISEQEMKLKIAVQCIEACREEFDYRAGHTGVSPEQHTVFIHHAQLCANALKAIQE